MNSTELYAAFFATAVFAGIVTAILWNLVKKALDMGKAWRITLPPTMAAEATIARVRVPRSGFWLNKKAQTATLAQSPAAYPTRKGPLFLIAASGAALVSPPMAFDHATGKPVAEDPSLLRKLLTWNPSAYFEATQQNDIQDLYASNKEKEHWMVKVAPLFIIFAIALMAMLGFVLWKVLPAFAKQGQATILLGW